MSNVVKIDETLLEKVRKLISKNKFKYSNAKQFINQAVSEKIKKEGKNERK